MPEPHQHAPVFHDPTRRRQRGMQAAFGLFAVGLGLLGAALVISVSTRPALPALHLPDQPTRAGHRAALHTPDPEPDALAASSETRGTVAPARTMGFYVNWDDNSFTSLRRNAEHLDTLVPEWWHLGDGGTLVEDDPRKTATMLDYLRQHDSGLEIVPLINNYDQASQAWASDRLATTLRGEETRRALIGNLLDGLLAAKRRGAKITGVNIDFENVPDAAQSDLNRFMGELTTRLHAAGLTVAQDLPMDDPAFNYRALGEEADQLVLMGYDQHEDSGEAGPVAAQGWLAHNLTEQLAHIPARKVVLAVGNYGYDWTEGRAGATELSFQDALTLAHDQGAAVRLDPQSLNPTFDYQDDAGRTHHVWYLDAVSGFDQLLGAQHAGVRNFALWRLGTEDPGVWPTLAHHAQPGPALARGLAALHSGFDIDYNGNGELLRVTHTPQDGRRQVHIDAASGLVTAERVQTFASPYVIQRWSATGPRRIALTFDDGPDPTFTPQILDILRRERAQATFFVVGLQGQANPALLRRIVEGGHELGNHSFTHPNLAAVPAAQFDLELNATERLLEGATGRRTLLFRPPFAEDVEPATPDQAGLVARASRMGYYTVGMGVDPGDWQRPGADAIVKETLAQIEQGSGQVVLLHDAGGDRSQTVAALPRLIHALRARGYQLVTVGELIGVPRDQVMPRVSGPERWFARLSDLNFSTFRLLGTLLSALFFVGIALSVGRLLFISTLALIERWREPGALPAQDLSVSVIVPAYNEAKVICQTVASLLAQDLADLDILVIDDGSTDGTGEALRAVYGDHPRVQLHRVPNGGKSRALNHGLALARTDLVVMLDADTQLNRSAVRLLRDRFVDAGVAAVAGNAKVGNRVNLLTRWQALEYVTAQNLERRALALLNGIGVVPGAIGAWRTGVLRELGGLHHDTLAEDADLTMRLLGAGHRATYALGAVAYTEAPQTVRAFQKQRFRWMFGTLQATWKQRRGLGRRGARRLALFTLPNVVIFQIVFPFVSALLDLSMLATVAWTLLQQTYHPAEHALANTGQVLAFYALFLLVDLLAAALAFVLEPGEDWRLLLWLPLQRFSYRQLMYLVAIRAVFAALHGHQVGWNKLERTGTVALASD